MDTLNHLPAAGRFLLAATYTGLWFAAGAGLGRFGRRR